MRGLWRFGRYSLVLLPCFLHTATCTSADHNPQRLALALPSPESDLATDKPASDDSVRGSNFSSTVIDVVACADTRSKTPLPGVSETCEAFLDNKQQVSEEPSWYDPLGKMLHESLEFGGYCTCQQPSPATCGGSLCLNRDTLVSDRVVDAQNGLTCGQANDMVPYLTSPQVCPMVSALAPLCCNEYAIALEIPLAFRFYNLANPRALPDLPQLRNALRGFADSIAAEIAGATVVSSQLHQMDSQTECPRNDEEEEAGPCIALEASFNITVLPVQDQEKTLREMAQHSDRFQRQVNSHLRDSIWEVLEAVPTRVASDSCQLCANSNAGQSFWLPMGGYKHDPDWARNELCPALSQVYELQGPTECSNYDRNLHRDWSQRYGLHYVWSLPVDLASLCSCGAVEPVPFCPVGTTIDADKPVMADLTCGVVEQVLPLISDLETFDNLQSYQGWCCEPEPEEEEEEEEQDEKPPKVGPVDAVSQDIRTSMVIAAGSITSINDLRNLQDAFGILVEDIVQGQQQGTSQRFLRQRSLAVELDSTSPAIRNPQEVTCPSYWVSSTHSTCQTVNASYSILMTTWEDTTQYAGRTNDAIDSGRLYQVLRQVHPATDLVILGTPRTAFAPQAEAEEAEKQEEEQRAEQPDKNNNDKGNGERNIAFVLGLGIGAAVALLCTVICFRCAMIASQENRKQQEQEEQDLLESIEEGDSYEEDDEYEGSLEGDDEEPKKAVPSWLDEEDSVDSSKAGKQSSTEHSETDPSSRTKEEEEEDIQVARGFSEESSYASSHKDASSLVSSDPQEEADDHKLSLMESPIEAASPDMLADDGLSSHKAEDFHSPPRVSKTLFRDDDDDDDEEEGEDEDELEIRRKSSPILERMVEKELLERMQECTSEVDSAASEDNSSISSVTKEHTSTAAETEAEASASTVSQTPNGCVTTATLLSGDLQGGKQQQAPGEEAKEEEAAEKGMVFETLVSGQFVGQEWEHTSASSSSSATPPPPGEKEEVFSGSPPAPDEDFANELCFDGQPGHIGFANPC